MKVKVLNTIGFYLKLWLRVLRVSISKLTAYRVEVISRIFRGLFVLAIQIIFVTALVGNSGQFLSYTASEVYLVTGFFNLIGYLSWSIFSINLGRLEEKIMKGEFDVTLYKPVSSIFGASFLEFHIDDFVTSISGLILVGYYIVTNWASITFLNIIFMIIAVVIGIVLWFCIDLIVSAFDFVFIRSGLREIRNRLNGIGRFPVDVWGSYNIIFYTVFPVAFIGLVPARVLIDVNNYEYLIYGLVLSIIFLIISHRIWYICLSKYTSVG